MMGVNSLSIEEIGAALVADAEKAWMPVRERSSLDYYEVQEVHVSSLVKRNAEDCVRQILGENLDGDTTNMPYYGWRGDLLGEGMSPDFQYREIRLEAPSVEGWKAVGTADAFRVFEGGWVVVGEWKTNLWPERGKHDEMAYRQAANYLAMWWKAYQTGQRHFKATDDEYRRVNEQIRILKQRTGVGIPDVVPPALDFICGDGLRPAGVHIRIASAYPDSRMAKFFSLSNQDLDAFHAFYVQEKTKQVVLAVEAEDPMAAKSFDNMNPTEFTRAFEKMKEPPIETKLLLKTIAEARKMGNTSKKTQEKTRREAAYAFASMNMEPGDYKLSEGLTAHVKAPKPGDMTPYIRFSGPEWRDVNG